MNNIENNYNNLIAQAQYLLPEELALISRAFEFAEEAHSVQKRKSGEPYIHHPIAVARILAEMQMDSQTIAAALLHDVIEDTPATYQQVETEFSTQIAQLVLGVTNFGEKVKALKKVRAAVNEDLTHEQRAAVNLVNLFLSMAADVRVIIIKLADRLHNMRTIHWLPAYKQQRKARETVDLFVPLASRLGIQRIKEELEDLCLQVLDPEAYAEIAEMLQARGKLLDRDLEDAISQLQHILQEDGCDAAVMPLPEHVSRLYQHIKTNSWESAQTYDGLRVQIVTKTQPNCYAALGSVHNLWAPVPGRFVDFIAVPKEGLYRALHTVVIGLRGHPLEVRILTKQMQDLAEYGIIAHLRPTGSPLPLKQLLPRLPWIEELSELPIDDPKTFLSLFKSEITPERIRVFTPKGDVIDLPSGATPVDFAYAVHTEIGHSCRKAIVNSKHVPLNTPLNSGDQVEIIKSLTPSPDRAWLDEDLAYTQQPYTRRKIRRWFSRRPEDALIEQGRAIIEKEILCWAKCEGWDITRLDHLARQRGLTVESFSLRVGRGDINASELGTFVLNEVLGNPQETAKPLSLEINAMDRPNLLRDAAQIVAEENVNLMVAWARATEETGLAIVSMALDTPDIRKIVRIVHRFAHMPSALQVHRCLEPQMPNDALAFPIPLSHWRPCGSPTHDHLIPQTS